MNTGVTALCSKIFLPVVMQQIVKTTVVQLAVVLQCNYFFIICNASVKLLHQRY